MYKSYVYPFTKIQQEEELGYSFVKLTIISKCNREICKTAKVQSIPEKVVTKIIQNRMEHQTEKIFTKTKPVRSTIDHGEIET